MYRLIIILLVIQASVGICQDKEEWRVRPYPGDSLPAYYDRVVDSRESDTSYTRSFESGTMVSWDISEYGQPEAATFIYFDSVASTDIHYSQANLKICYDRNWLSSYEPMIEYWAVSNQVWYHKEMYLGFDIDCDKEGATFRRSFKESNLRYSFPLVFDESNESITMYSDVTIREVGAPRIYHHFLRGEAKVIGIGTLKTIAGVYENCYLLEETYKQTIDGTYPGEAIFKRWSWIHPQVKWPIAVLEEWISLYTGSARVTVSNAYMIQAKNLETLLGTHQVQDETFHFYPNPTSDFIHLDNSISGTIYVYSMDGQLVSKTNVQNSTQISLAELSPGIYQIMAQSDSGAATTMKVVKSF